MRFSWQALIVAISISWLASLGSASLAAESADDVFWNSVRTTDVSEEYEAYLQVFPRGKYVEDAKSRIKLLRMRASIEQSKINQENQKAQQEAQDKARQQAEQQLATQKKMEAEKRASSDMKRPGRVFRDCAACPEMVILPRGKYLMGSPPSESGREDDEGPQREVTIDYALAVGKYEITFDEWSACSNDKVKACDWYDPPDRGWGRGKQPVIEVSRDHAESYTRWLSNKTGKPYRLLTEAEWEYAARAGTTTRYSVGDCIYTDQANLSVLPTQDVGGTGQGKKGQSAIDCRGKAQRSEMKPIKVGSYPPNAFGLHDMQGNVLEWVQDCWEKSYAAAPSNGDAYRPKGCLLNIRRGGAWNDGPRKLRAAARSFSVPLVTPYSSAVGFRVARPVD